MALTAPTVDSFRARFPAFADVQDGVITSALTEASRQVDETWTEDDFAMGRMLYAAHVLTMDGHGNGAEAEMARAGTLGVSSMSSGSLSLAWRDGGVSLLSTTSYGRRFRAYLRRNGYGVAVANACIA